jgi:hypothetical protein
LAASPVDRVSAPATFCPDDGDYKARTGEAPSTVGARVRSNLPA